MSATTLTSYGVPGKNGFNLQIVVELPLNIRVSAGTFSIGGQQYTLGQDEVYTCVPTAINSTRVTGYMVWDSSANETALLIDPVERYSSAGAISFPSGQYSLLHVAFEIEVPALATALVDTDLLIRQIVAQPEE
jgi:hypothetical protein